MLFNASKFWYVIFSHAGSEISDDTYFSNGENAIHKHDTKEGMAGFISSDLTGTVNYQKHVRGVKFSIYFIPSEQGKLSQWLF